MWPGVVGREIKYILWKVIPSCRGSSVSFLQEHFILLGGFHLLAHLQSDEIIMIL